MLYAIHPKLPMRDINTTRNFYIERLGFLEVGADHFDNYLMVRKDNIEIHFFKFVGLDPLENDAQVYIRTDDIEKLYQIFLNNKIQIHPYGDLKDKPWGQKEFSILDPDYNLLTFGQAIKEKQA